jgi:hypothetical protein
MIITIWHYARFCQAGGGGVAERAQPLVTLTDPFRLHTHKNMALQNATINIFKKGKYGKH